jgi:hypothetical protein
MQGGLLVVCNRKEGVMGNTVRTTISVPREVKKRMDAAERVNWSAVATEAFEAKLLELESTMEVSNVEQAVARLKAAGKAEENEQRQEGKEEGRRWAMQDATPRQLRLLAEYDFPHDYSGWEDMLGVFANRNIGNDGIPTHLYRVLLPREEDGWAEVAAFWEGVLGEGGDERIADFDFALGFVEGAVEFWRSVESKVG